MHRPLSSPLSWSRHALTRAGARRISPAAIDAALTWGRRTWSYGDQNYRLDRRSVARARMAGVRIDQHEGVTVVLSADGTVRTTFRNRDPHRIRR